MQQATEIFAQPDTDFEIASLDPGYKHADKKHPFIFNLRFVVLGIIFGILLVKSEVISWFRIQEMFHLQSFHMYGVIGSAITTGIISVWLIKRFNIKTISGEEIFIPSKKFHKGQVYGGLLFGFGWALTGACPGPMYAQIGAGSLVIIVSLLSAIAGTWVYGLLRDKLPH
ncbi:MAG: DUF6691 family protein [Ginsengibacter sp.]